MAVKKPLCLYGGAPKELAAGDSLPSSDSVIKAWVNFNGTGTVAIRASYNISSVTDNGTGDYTVNFATALADADYAVAVGMSNNRGVAEMSKCQLHSVASSYANADPTSAGFRMNFRDAANNPQDPTYVNVIIAR